MPPLRAMRPLWHSLSIGHVADLNITAIQPARSTNDDRGTGLSEIVASPLITAAISVPAIRKAPGPNVGAGPPEGLTRTHQDGPPSGLDIYFAREAL